MTQENKINIAELLKDCPKGMELDCTMYDNLYFNQVYDDSDCLYKIGCYTIVDEIRTTVNFTEFGTFNTHANSKCVIFPKGKTTWEGFQRPFKDGDILSYQYEGFTNRTIYIYMQHSRMNTTYYVALSGNFDSDFMINDKEECALNGYNDSVRLATEEEKEKLFQAIKDNGYRWNAETKTLEKLVKPKFKVGNKIEYINGKNKDGVKEGIILSITNDTYDVAVTNDMGIFVPISEQDNWELAPSKFDISNLKPFDKVLVRNGNKYKWNISFYGFYDIKYVINYPYECCGNSFAQCIPYEGNEHLLGTTNDCDEYFKNW